MSEYWFFAAGGTGRRVALAMLHMCAAGALAGDTLHIRYADTDVEEAESDSYEGFVTLREQYERYKKLHEIFKSDGNLFSCKIDYPDGYSELANWTRAINKLFNDDPLTSEDTIQTVYAATHGCRHSFEEKLLIQALLGRDNTTKIHPFCGLCAAPNVGALLINDKVKNNPELENFFGVVGAEAETDFNDRHARNPSDPLVYDPEKKYNLFKEYNKDHPIAFLASSFGGTGAAFLPAVWQQLVKAEKTPRRCAMLFLGQYFSLHNWTEDLFEKKQKAMKKYLQEHHKGGYYILPCLEEMGIRVRGKHTDKEQKNWPSETEYLAAILMCSFFRNKDFNWKVNPKDDMNGELPDLKERYKAFDKLAQCWCHDFEGSKIEKTETDESKPQKWYYGASWMGRIPMKTRREWKEDDPRIRYKLLLALLKIINWPFGTDWPKKYYIEEKDKPATLEDTTLKDFMKDWLRWRRQIDDTYQPELLLYETDFAPEVLDEAAADACWRKASTMVNERKSKLVNDLFEVCRQFAIERA